MHAGDLRLLVVRPTLQRLGLHSAAAEELLMGTAAQESHLGELGLRQRGGGPALGIFQCEPATHDDLWRNYLRHRRNLWDTVVSFLARTELPLPHVPLTWERLGGQLVWNLAYATVMARLVYLRAPARLPEAGDLPALAAYWKRWYNTPLGAGTVEEFIANYRRLVTPA